MNTHDPKDANGQAKPQLHLLPTVALQSCSEALRLGANRYGPWNWRTGKVCASTYLSAMMRHALAWRDGEDNDPDSGASHLGHVMANCAILLDAAQNGTLEDDRPGKKEEVPTTKPSQVSSSLTEGWRELGPDEVVQAGDEWWHDRKEKWVDAKRSIGGKIKDLIAPTPFRRRVTLPAATGSLDVLQKEEKFNTFPEVGARLRFVQHKPGWAAGTVITFKGKSDMSEYGFPNELLTDGTLELVTEPPIPEGFPPVPETPGFRKVNRGFGWQSPRNVNYLTAMKGWPEWLRYTNRQTDTVPECFYIELIPEEPTGEDCSKIDIVNPIPESPLQLEVGKYYLNRKGERVGPIVKNFGSDAWQFSSENTIFSYRQNGRMAYKEDRDSLQDLISLAPDEETSKEQKDEIERLAREVIASPEFKAVERGPELISSYPPPESEWPEKPDAGPGMVWERQADSGEFISGERYVILTCDYKEWRDNSPDLVGWYERIVFRAIPKSKLLDALEGIKWIAGSRGDNQTMVSALESVKSRAVTALKEYQSDAVPAPVTENPEEARAKAALEPGWVGPVRGPIKGYSGLSSDVAMWIEDRQSWDYTRNGGGAEFLYAIRANTELARLNGLEPENIQRWSKFSEGLICSSDGEWVRYSDHLAAIEALRGKGGEK